MKRSSTNSNPYGNGCALFTGSGSGRKYQKIDCGQVGINVLYQYLCRCLVGLVRAVALGVALTFTANKVLISSPKLKV